MLQTEATTVVKWKGKFSTGFLTQGIRQEAKLSPTLYKSYNNQLLDVLRDNNIGAKIGTTCTFIGCPTVADDIVLISYHPEDLQHALHIVHNETRRDKVREQPFNLKGRVMVFFLKKYSDSQCC